MELYEEMRKYNRVMDYSDMAIDPREAYSDDPDEEDEDDDDAEWLEPYPDIDYEQEWPKRW